MVFRASRDREIRRCRHLQTTPREPNLRSHLDLMGERQNEAWLRELTVTKVTGPAPFSRAFRWTTTNHNSL